MKKAAIRFTPEQKAKMKKKALAMLEAGQTQQEIAKALKTTVTTLRALIKGENYPRQNRSAAGKAPKAVVVKVVPVQVESATAKPQVSLGKSIQNPMTMLAEKYGRLEELSKRIASVKEEQTQVKAEMKSAYEAIGKLILK